MTTAVDAIYQNGVFRPTTPPDLPDGTAVRITVEPRPSAAAPPGPLDPAVVYARIRAIAALSDPNGPPENTSENVDAILYGKPGDPGDVR